MKLNFSGQVIKCYDFAWYEADGTYTEHLHRLEIAYNWGFHSAEITLIYKKIVRNKTNELLQAST